MAKQRCFFNYKHGIKQFGYVYDSDHDGERLLICGDDGHLYARWRSEVILL